VTKKLQFRWVDLSKPLKKQLEKYAQISHVVQSPKLYFGVIFYVANAHKIVDDVARYIYLIGSFTCCENKQDSVMSDILLD